MRIESGEHTELERVALCIYDVTSQVDSALILHEYGSTVFAIQNNEIICGNIHCHCNWCGQLLGEHRSGKARRAASFSQ